MTAWPLLSHLLYGVLAIYAVSVPLLMIWSVAERRTLRREKLDSDRLRRWPPVRGATSPGPGGPDREGSDAPGAGDFA